jgi:hypothetical protein
MRQMLGRTLAAWSEPADRQLLQPVIEGKRSTPPNDLSPAAQRMAELFLNHDPRKFDILYAGLPASVRSELEALTVSSRLESPAAQLFLRPRCPMACRSGRSGGI